MMGVTRALVMALALGCFMPGVTGRAMASTGEMPALLLPVIAALERDGYTGIETGWTWLGRLHVTAWLNGRQRELVIHPTSGEVLRDVLLPLPTQMAGDGGSETASSMGNGGAVAAATAVPPGPDTATVMGATIVDPAAVAASSALEGPPLALSPVPGDAGAGGVTGSTGAGE